MRTTGQIILTLALLLGVAFPMRGQNIIFKHLTTEDGLSQFTVNCLYVDENNVLWIGTRDGLNRYDGNSIQTYKIQKNGQNGLFSNKIMQITGNREGKIYVLCVGVTEYDQKTQKFKPLSSKNATCLYYNDGLFMGIKNEIHKYNEGTEHFELYYYLADKNQEISCMLSDEEYFYIGTKNSGVYRMKIYADNGFNDSEDDDNEPEHIIDRGTITCVYRDSDGELWIGSQEEGLYTIQPDGTVRNFRNKPNDRQSIASNFVRTCCEDDLGNLWIGTFNGLVRYDKNTGKFQNYTTTYAQNNELSDPSIWSIVKDAQGTIWLGTYYGGVNYFNPEYEIYSRYSYSHIERQGLSNPVVSIIDEDKNGSLWIGTEGGGLCSYDRKTHEFKWFTSDKLLNHSHIKALHYDSKHEILYIGTHLDGVTKLDIRSGEFSHYKMEAGNAETLPSNIVHDIEPYQDLLIIATQEGVCLFNPQTGKCFLLFQEENQTRHLKTAIDVLMDKSGTLWLATTGRGVFNYRFDTKELTNYRNNPSDPHSLSNNNVKNIMEDSRGRLWFATAGGGLNLYRPESDDFENFDVEKSRLGSDHIYHIVESPISGKLLLNTNVGFTIFDPQTQKAENYSTGNGAPLSEINEKALYAAPDGEIFLGGTHGMISFNETKLDFAPKPYKIIFSNLFVNGKEIRVGDETEILKSALYCTPKITLQAKQSLFSIEFATTNYVSANKDDILYKLEGASNDWINMRGQNTITFSNLNAGTYHLTIRANGKDESLCPPARLTIRILPPFYKTPLAYILYVLAALALVWFLIHYYLSNAKLQADLKYEQQHGRDVEALNQSKLRFFTNISHEFRTPLTLIVSHVETLMQQQNFTPSVYNKVLGIYKNSLQLRALITELLDFRKQEQGYMKIKTAPHDIVDFLYEYHQLFKEFAATHQIDFDFKNEVEDLEVWYDQKQMQKVVNNLISNAFKHTEEGGAITLGIRVEKGNAVVWVSDTGVGISPERIDKIFLSFYQIDDEQDKGGTGIGLALTKGIVELHHGTIRVESELGKGSTFIFTLPLGRGHLSEEEIGKQTVEEETVKLEEEGMELPTELEENAPNKRLPDTKMLIVEDNGSIREMLADIFKPYYTVLTATDGAEGWEMAQSQMPDIVVSDVVMPRMSGTELCKKIKKDFTTCHIPVVLLTAQTNIEQNIEGLRIGADDYITKPFDTTLLISRCNNLVNSRITLQEKFSRQPQVSAQMLATNPLDEELIERAMRVIEEHLGDTKFNVTTFCHEMGISRTNLFAKLKAITGQTPNDFILTVRLKKAAQMLRNNPELNISDISDMTGFNHPRYFSKCFKDIYHVSPLAYRKK